MQEEARKELRAVQSCGSLDRIKNAIKTASAAGIGLQDEDMKKAREARTRAEREVQEKLSQSILPELQKEMLQSEAKKSLQKVVDAEPEKLEEALEMANRARIDEQDPVMVLAKAKLELRRGARGESTLEMTCEAICNAMDAKISPEDADLKNAKQKFECDFKDKLKKAEDNTRKDHKHLGELRRLIDLAKTIKYSAEELQTSVEVVEEMEADQLGLAEALKRGESPLRKVRINLIGRGRSGKTSTLKRLRRQGFKEESDEEDGGTATAEVANHEVGNDGEWQVDSAEPSSRIRATEGQSRAPDGGEEMMTLVDGFSIDDLPLRLQVWDYPGQGIYAPLNMLHFTEKAIYLVFCNLESESQKKSLSEEWSHLEFWLLSVNRLAPKSPIFVVGTKRAKRPQTRDFTDNLDLRIFKLLQLLQAKQRALAGQIVKPDKDMPGRFLFEVENAQDVDKGLQDLRLCISQVASAMFHAKLKSAEDHPVYQGLLRTPMFKRSVLRLEDALDRDMSEGHPSMHLVDKHHFAYLYLIHEKSAVDAKELEGMLDALHELGVIVRRHKDLKDPRILLCPGLVVKAMAKILFVGFKHQDECWSGKREGKHFQKLGLADVATKYPKLATEGRTTREEIFNIWDMGKDEFGEELKEFLLTLMLDARLIIDIGHASYWVPMCCAHEPGFYPFIVPFALATIIQEDGCCGICHKFVLDIDRFNCPGKQKHLFHRQCWQKWFGVWQACALGTIRSKCWEGLLLVSPKLGLSYPNKTLGRTLSNPPSTSQRSESTPADAWELVPTEQDWQIEVLLSEEPSTSAAYTLVLNNSKLWWCAENASLILHQNPVAEQGCWQNGWIITRVVGERGDYYTIACSHQPFWQLCRSSPKQKHKVQLALLEDRDPMQKWFITQMALGGKYRIQSAGDLTFTLQTDSFPTSTTPDSGPGGHHARDVSFELEKDELRKALQLLEAQFRKEFLEALQDRENPVFDVQQKFHSLFHRWPTAQTQRVAKLCLAELEQETGRERMVEAVQKVVGLDAVRALSVSTSEDSWAQHDLLTLRPAAVGDFHWRKLKESAFTNLFQMQWQTVTQSKGWHRGIAEGMQLKEHCLKYKLLPLIMDEVMPNVPIELNKRLDSCKQVLYTSKSWEEIRAVRDLSEQGVLVPSSVGITKLRTVLENSRLVSPLRKQDMQASKAKASEFETYNHLLGEAKKSALRAIECHKDIVHELSELAHKGYDDMPNSEVARLALQEQSNIDKAQLANISRLKEHFSTETKRILDQLDTSKQSLYSQAQRQIQELRHVGNLNQSCVEMPQQAFGADFVFENWPEGQDHPTWSRTGTDQTEDSSDNFHQCHHMLEAEGKKISFSFECGIFAVKNTCWDAMEDFLSNPDWFIDGKPPGYIWLMDGYNARYVVEEAVFVRKFAYRERIGEQNHAENCDQRRGNLTLKFLLLKTLPVAPRRGGETEEQKTKTQEEINDGYYVRKYIGETWQATMSRLPVQEADEDGSEAKALDLPRQCHESELPKEAC